MAYAVARAVTGRDAAETYRGRNPNSHDRLQAQLVASPATGYMHQNVIMCSPKAVLASGGGSRFGRVRCSTCEACEVAQDAARWTAQSAYTHSPRLPSFSHWLLVLEFPPTRAGLLQTRPSRQS